MYADWHSKQKSANVKGLAVCCRQVFAVSFKIFHIII